MKREAREKNSFASRFTLHERRSSMISKKITINATPQQCFKVITDYKNYPKFLEDLKKIDVKKRKGNTCEVTHHIEVVKDISYTLLMTEHPKKHIVEWTFVCGDAMRDNNGSWVLKEIKKGQTQATYNIEIRFGLFVPSFVSKILTEQHLPKLLKAFKKRIETNS